MLTRLRLRKPSPALVISCLALFVALSGTSYAVVVLPKNSVGAKQIKTNAVGPSEIAKNAVRAQEVRDGSLSAADFAPGQLAAGPPGPPGPAGPSNPNADTLDGLDSTDFLSATGTAVDSAKLGGIGPTGFHRVGDTVSNSQRLGGHDRVTLLSRTYFTRSQTTSGPGGANADSDVSLNCNDGPGSGGPNAQLVTGGFNNLDAGTHLIASYPQGGNTTRSSWIVRWHNDGSADFVTIWVLCSYHDR